jgi:parallel beta-helix repeat protein
MSRNRIAAVIMCTVAAVACGACGGGGGDNSAAPGPPPCDAVNRTCYVRASVGRVGNSGADPAHALLAISGAMSIVQSKYSIVVGPGVYNEGVSNDRQNQPAPHSLRLIADVTGAQTGDQAGTVVVDASSSATGAGFRLTSSSDSLIDGFTIVGGRDGGVVIKSGNTNLAVRNCIVHDNPGDGIRIQDSANVIIFNNLVYGNGGLGIGIVSGSAGARVFSNTVVDNAGRGITVGTSTTASTGVAILNNILQDNGTGGTPTLENIKVFTNSLSGTDEDYNLVFPATYLPANLPGPQSHDVNADAAFVGASADDFHLSKANPKSPAIDAGGALNIGDEWIVILHQRTTTGTNLDNGILDLGFHFLR